MNIYIILCLISSAIFALHFVYVYRLQAKNVTTFFILCFTHLASSICMTFFAPGLSEIRKINTGDFLLIIGASAITFIAKYLQYRSYQKIDLTYVSSFSALTPILGLILGVFFFNDSINAIKALSISLIFISVYLIHIPADSRRNLLIPIKIIKDSIHYRMALISSVLPVFSLLLSKMALLNTHVTVFSFLCLFFIGAFSLAALTDTSIYIKKEFWENTWKDLLLATAFMCAAQLLNAYLIKSLEISVFSSVSRITILFQTLLSYFILEQKNNFRWKLGFSILIFIGFLGLLR